MSKRRTAGNFTKERRLKNALKSKTQVMRLRFEKCMNSRVYKEPLQKINDNYLLLDKIVKNIENIGIKKIKDCKLLMTKNITRLDALSPLKTLTRGYSITSLKESKLIIKDVNDVKTGDLVEIRVENGIIDATVN